MHIEVEAALLVYESVETLKITLQVARDVYRAPLAGCREVVVITGLGERKESGPNCCR